MKRELKDLKRLKYCSGCCPGHDDWPCDTYRNNRSKSARARDIKKEHQWVRRKKKYLLQLELKA
ncbi:hypothetical protein tf_39 [Pseudomonas phage tf]|jgi:hypothetical protein|uniref:Uncharacterized protein n=1 Tax=Pseudomonas phage tf TaxID=1114179 RepID=I2FLR0_9CAUD|nr:hypothetical protein tf_39 [Pseudomonas phage tf]CCE60794.1 hypothetical protein tf_39 [Pseudomonas phage tf]